MDEPIRILHIVTHMNRGGLESMLMNYYRCIDKTKVQFDFLTHRTETKDYDLEILSMGGKIYHLPMLNPFDKKYIQKLDVFFSEHKEYKIVHSHLDTMSTYPLKYAKKHGIPIRIAHSHTKSQEKNIKFFIKLLSKRQIPKYATHLFACSKEAGLWMYGNRKFQIMNNAIDSKSFTYNNIQSIKIKNELGLCGKFVVGHVGRFNNEKNHKFLIDVFYEIHKRKSNSILLLVGEGDLYEDIQQKIHMKGLSQHVLQLGSRSDIPELLLAMDVFVFPSLYEGLGIAAIEAQASGLHTIVSENIPDEAYITDLIEKEYLDSTADMWAKSILKYAEGYQRIDTSESIKLHGYGIEESTKHLQSFYINEIEKYI